MIIDIYLFIIHISNFNNRNVLSAPSCVSCLAQLPVQQVCATASSLSSISPSWQYFPSVVVKISLVRLAQQRNLIPLSGQMASDQQCAHRAYVLLLVFSKPSTWTLSPYDASFLYRFCSRRNSLSTPFANGILSSPLFVECIIWA